MTSLSALGRGNCAPRGKFLGPIWPICVALSIVFYQDVRTIMYVRLGNTTRVFVVTFVILHPHHLSKKILLFLWIPMGTKGNKSRLLNNNIAPVREKAPITGKQIFLILRKVDFAVQETKKSPPFGPLPPARLLQRRKGKNTGTATASGIPVVGKRRNTFT